MKNNKYFEEDEEDLDDFSVEEDDEYDRWYWGEDDSEDLELEEDDDSYLSFYPSDEDDEDDY